MQDGTTSARERPATNGGAPPAAAVRPIPLAASDLPAGLTATIAFLCAALALLVGLIRHGGLTDDARTLLVGLPAVAAIPGAIALWRVGRFAGDDGLHVRRVAEPALVGALLLAVAAGRALPAVPHALLPGEARMAAAGLAAIAAWVIVGAAATRVLPGGHRLVLGLVAGTMFVATLLSMESPLLHGFPATRADGWLGYTNATAAAAAVVLLGGMRGLAAARAPSWPLLRVASGVALGTSTIVLAASASRAMTLAALVGAVWLVSRGRPRGTRAAGLLVVAEVAIFVAVATVAAESGATIVPWLVLLAGLLAAQAIPTIAAAVAGRLPAPPPEGSAAHRRQRRIGWFALLVLLIVLVVPARNAWHSFTSDSAITSASGANRLTSASGNHRWRWWQEGGAAWRTQPVVGLGGGAFEVEHLRRRNDVSNAAHVHLLPLQLLLEGGLLFGGAALIGLLLVVVALWRAAMPRSGGASAALGAIAVTLLLGSTIDWTIDVPLVATCFALAAGAAVAIGAGAIPDRKRVPPRVRMRGNVVLAATAVAATVACAVPLAAVAFDWHAGNTRSAGHSLAAERWGWRAFRLVPSNERFLHVVADARGGAGDQLAQRRVDQAMRVDLRNDVGAWGAVYDIAPVWHGFALQQLARRQQHRLDPLEFPAPSPRVTTS